MSFAFFAGMLLDFFNGFLGLLLTFGNAFREVV
jgi:hypothetical protein